jgi:hypothetical protein
MDLFSPLFQPAISAPGVGFTLAVTGLELAGGLQVGLVLAGPFRSFGWKGS